MEQITAVVDYAFPTILAEKSLKQMHEAVLRKDFEEAKKLALNAMAECRLIYHALIVMEEKQ